AVNDAPVAVVDYSTTPEDTPVNISVLSNDSDVDSPLGTPTITDPPNHGTATVNGDGTITYTPNPNFNGVDSLVYQICDNGVPPLCDTALVIITVVAVNDPPVAVYDRSGTTPNIPVTINVLSNDYDVDSPLGIPAITDTPSHGMVTVNPNGSITYVPNLNFTGIDSFIYQICDNAVPPLCDTALVIVKVECGVLIVKVFLQGPYDTLTNIMTTALNVNHLLPGQDVLLGPSPFAPLFGASTPPGQPYDTGPWNYFGSEGDGYGDVSTNPGSVPYPGDITDWVFVSVREGDSAVTSKIFECAGMLHSNGTVEIPSACGCVNLTLSGPYYVVINHRNHLPIMSGSLYPVNGVLTKDFSTQDSWIGELFPGVPFGIGQRQVEAGVWAMLAGNGRTNPITEEYDLNSGDFTNWNISQNVILHYLGADHTMDADVNSVDNTIWRINFNNVTLIPH
ncbi:MAG: cadherin-like domain-containing protein, partial [Saprospiraceae bacterium]